MRLKKFLIINLSLCLGMCTFSHIPAYSQNADTPVSYQDTANDYYQKGMSAFNTGNYMTAINLLEQALKLNPQDTTTRNNLAAAYINKGSALINKNITGMEPANDFRKAIFYLKYDENTNGEKTGQDNLSIATTNLINFLNAKKISLSPKSHMKMAKELRGQGAFKEAIVEFNEALSDQSLRPEALEALGDVMNVLQKDNKACDYYEQALSIDPDKPDLHLKFAHSLNKIGNLDGAVKEYNVVLASNDKDQEAIAALETIWRTRVQESPQDPATHMNLGVILQKKGDLNGALAEYNESSKIDPSNITLRLNMGTLFQAQGNFPMAVSAYDTILQANPTDPLAHYYRATALKQMGKTPDAIAELQIVLKLDPTNAQARKSLFDYIRGIPNDNEAIAAITAITQSNPNDALIQYNAAYELHLRKKLDEAVDLYQRVIAIDPKLIDSYLNIASIYRERGMYDDANAALKDAAKVDPDNHKVKDMLSQVTDASTYTKYQNASQKYEQKDYDGAVKAYQDIINTSTPTADVYVGLGAAYQAMSKNDDAINAYEKALQLDKNNADAYYSMGTAYYAKGNNSRALELYKKALSLNPENKEIKEAIASIKLANVDDTLQKGMDEYNAGHYQKAMLTFNNILKSSENGYAYYYRAMTYDALGKYRSAIPDYQKAAQKLSDLADVYYSMAVDYDSLKLYSQAKTTYKKYVASSKDANSEYIKYAKQRIKQLGS